MTGLLVSVRNAREAGIALAGGADLIDVKEPDQGALGAADVETIHEVCGVIAGRCPCSAALGELLDDEFNFDDLPATLDFVKFGLAGCRKRSDWQHLWCRQLVQMPPDTQAVAVVYADWRAAAAPDPEAVIHAAVETGCAALLIDTWDKRGGGLFDILSRSELARLMRAARDAGMITVLAGSLTLETIPLALELAADYIAVRGAACVAGRTADVSEQRVAELAAVVRTARLPQPAQ